MKRAGIIIGIVLIVAAYVFGFWPQYENARQLRFQLKMATDQLDQARAKLGLCAVQDRLLATIGQASAKNYGNAAALSTQFFNEVREEEMRQTEPSAKAALNSILGQRDAVTSALAKGDPASVNLLNSLENTMFTLVDRELKGGENVSFPAS